MRLSSGTVSTIRMVHAQKKEMREVPVGPYLPKSMINLGYYAALDCDKDLPV